MRPLGTIEEELAGCLAANEAHPDAVAYWCHWHNKLLTPATPTETWRQRIGVILTHKPEHQRACRLRNFRPVIGRMPEVIEQALADCYQACVAYDQALTAYYQARTALNPAMADCYQAGTVLDQARTACESELTVQHNTEWPDNTWGGKDIFGNWEGSEGWK